jgi:hypothetical protein
MAVAIDGSVRGGGDVGVGRTHDTVRQSHGPTAGCNYHFLEWREGS